MTNPMTKPDNVLVILNSFYNSVCPVASIKPDYPPMGMPEAKAALDALYKAKFLKIIGRDETTKWAGGKAHPSIKDEHRNGLRAELRQKIEGL